MKSKIMWILSVLRTDMTDDLLLQYTLLNNGEEMGFLDDEEDMRMLAATPVTGVELTRLDRIIPDK